MGRKKNKQKRHNITTNTADYKQTLKDMEINCENPEVSIEPIKQSLKSETASNSETTEKNSDLTETEIEVLFEKYRPNTERMFGREYFIHSLCHFCKEELKERILCTKCHLISYCLQDHRSKHWPFHKDLCQAVVEVCADRQTDHIMQGSLNCSADEFRVFRFQNMIACEAKLKRPLDKWEREMFIFPNVCGTCYEHNPELLKICESCQHSGFCKNHGSQNHREWCDLLLRYKNIIKDQYKFGIVSPSIPNSKLCLVPPQLKNIKQFYKGVIKFMDFFEFVELTEITTYPLTASSVLLMRSQNHHLEKLTLHVVGAEAEFEINKLEKWEYYILHLIPGLQSLEIVFIGPELRLTEEQKMLNVCSKCKANNKSMKISFERDLYHKFSKKKFFSKPQMICVFNPGLYRTTGFNNEDTWSPSIEQMFAQECPVLTTAYTHREILLDVQRVQQTQKISLLCDPMLNPFSSLKPNLNFVSDEESPVIFKNQYYSVMCKA